MFNFPRSYKRAVQYRSAMSKRLSTAMASDHYKSKHERELVLRVIANQLKLAGEIVQVWTMPEWVRVVCKNTLTEKFGS